MNPSRLFAGLLTLAVFSSTSAQAHVGGHFPIQFEQPAVPASGVVAAPYLRVAKGVVFDDRNGNKVQDKGEPGIPNIRVSNQRTVVRTDSKGRYSLPVDEDTTIFVVKPRGWRTPLDENNLPRFYYIHKPKGSPTNLKYAGVPPTGPLPVSIDFPLYPQKEPDKFRAVLFADPQPRDDKEVEFAGHDVVEELIGVDAAFGVTLGDIACDNLDTFKTLNQKIGLIGIPWYNVIGNHDLNMDAADDKHSDETFEATYGPNYYSFDYGPTHFMVLDDVAWYAPKPGATRGYYVGEFGKQQLEWIKNDLAQIPMNQMVVLLMHIPLVNSHGYFEPSGSHVADRRELYRLIEKRPFSLSISGHTHYQEHMFISEKDGWKGPEPHHHVINVTVSGSWWSGIPDEKGIPNTTMRDGAPNGYSFLNFDGNKYSLEFKAAQRPANYQMNISAPEEVSAAAAAGTEVAVNVFGGSEKSKVEMRVGASGAWVPMQNVTRQDPTYVKLKERETTLLKGEPAFGFALPNAINTPHMWVGKLPANPVLGTHLIEVRTTDMFGKTYSDQRIIRVVASMAK